MRNKLMNNREINAWATQRMDNFNQRLKLWSQQRSLQVPNDLLSNDPHTLQKAYKKYYGDSAIRNYPQANRIFTAWHDDWNQKLSYAGLADVASRNPNMKSYERELKGNALTPSGLIHSAGYYHVTHTDVPTKLVKRDEQAIGKLDTTKYTDFISKHPKFAKAIDAVPAQNLYKYNHAHGWDDRNKHLTNMAVCIDGQSARDYGKNGQGYKEADNPQARAERYTRYKQVQAGQRLPISLLQGYEFSHGAKKNPNYNFGRAMGQSPELANALNVRQGKGLMTDNLLYDKSNNRQLTSGQVLERNRRFMVRKSTSLLNQIDKQDSQQASQDVVKQAQEIAKTAGANGVRKESVNAIKNANKERSSKPSQINSAKNKTVEEPKTAKTRPKARPRSNRNLKPRNVFYVGKDNKVHKETVHIPWKNLNQNVRNIHSEFLKNHPNADVMEVSTKSRDPMANRASALNMDVKTSRGTFKVEQLFQAGKTFTNVGSMNGALKVSPHATKWYVRSHSKGQKMTGFKMFGQKYPLKPRTMYYDWIYLHGLAQHPNVMKSLYQHDAFSDVFSNPKFAVNSQAKSNALFKSIVKQHGYDGFQKAMKDPKLFKQIDAQVNNDDVSKSIQQTTHAKEALKNRQSDIQKNTHKDEPKKDAKPKRDVHHKLNTNPSKTKSVTSNKPKPTSQKNAVFKNNNFGKFLDQNPKQAKMLATFSGTQMKKRLGNIVKKSHVLTKFYKDDPKTVSCLNKANQRYVNVANSLQSNKAYTDAVMGEHAGHVKPVSYKYMAESVKVFTPKDKAMNNMMSANRVKIAKGKHRISNANSYLKRLQRDKGRSTNVRGRINHNKGRGGIKPKTPKPSKPSQSNAPKRARGKGFGE